MPDDLSADMLTVRQTSRNHSDDAALTEVLMKLVNITEEN